MKRGKRILELSALKINLFADLVTLLKKLIKKVKMNLPFNFKQITKMSSTNSRQSRRRRQKEEEEAKSSLSQKAFD